MFKIIIFHLKKQKKKIVIIDDGFLWEAMEIFLIGDF